MAKKNKNQTSMTTDKWIQGIHFAIFGEKRELEKPAKQETAVEKPVEKQETAKPAEPETPVELVEPEKAAKPVAPTMIVKEGRKLSKAERKALRKQKKREEAEKKASSQETVTAAATATDKVKEAVAEGIETGEIDVVHKNPYIELIQSKVKSWDNQGNALDENGSIIVDANGNVVKVDPKAGMILMAMPQQQSQQQTA